MPMKNPPHPGLSVRCDCLEPLGLSVVEAAQSTNERSIGLNLPAPLIANPLQRPVLARLGRIDRRDIDLHSATLG